MPLATLYTIIIFAVCLFSILLIVYFYKLTERKLKEKDKRIEFLEKREKYLIEKMSSCNEMTTEMKEMIDFLDSFESYDDFDKFEQKFVTDKEKQKG